MRRTYRWFVATLCLALLQSCNSVPVRVDYDTKFSFDHLRTYAWAPATEAERQEKAKNGLLHERIQAAVDSYFLAHGYSKVDLASADFLVTHTVTVERRTQVYNTQISAGYGAVGYGRYGTSSGIGIGAGFPVESRIVEYKVGTLIIDVIDNRQQRLVWRGAGDRTLDETLKPEERINTVNTVVNEILDRFPPAPKTSK